MNITTKYDIGHKVWIIDDKNRARYCEIANLYFHAGKYAEDNSEIAYGFHAADGRGYSRAESEVFETKEQLLASL